MSPALLTAIDSTDHVHLIVGSNPLAGARCSRSLEVGATPILIAPEDATIHYSLMKRIDAGEVQWLKRGFQEADLTTLGRAEVDGVVDAVFITLGGKGSQSMQFQRLCSSITQLIKLKALEYRHCVAACGSLSMSSMLRTFAPSRSFRPIPTVPCRLV